MINPIPAPQVPDSGKHIALRQCAMIVDDDPHFTATLRYNLEKAGYQVIVRSDGEWAIRHIAKQPPSILLLDWDLPSLSGLDLCARIRACIEFDDMPIIMVTARDSEDDKIRALNNGADDYVTKPFAIAELLARMRAVVRRAKASEDETILSFGDLSMDTGSQQITRAGRAIDLTSIEYQILLLLMKRPGWVLSREQLINSIWNDDERIDVRTVDVHIGRLRASLNEPGEPDIIRTIRSSGYALANSVSLESESFRTSSSLDSAFCHS